MQFFSLFVFPKNKTRNNVLDRKETFLAIKKKNRIFPKGLTHAFGQRM